MDFKDFWTKFQAFWTKFRTTIYFRALLLLLLSVLAVLLLQSPIVCLSLILIPLTVLLIPHWFGERSLKNHAVNGVLFLVLTTILFAAIVTPGLLSLPQQPQSRSVDRNGLPAQASLSNGLVTPFEGSADTSFTFTVRMTSANASAAQFAVRALVTSGEGLDVTSRLLDMIPDPGGSFATGKSFTVSTTLSPQVHGFDFVVFKDVNSTDVLVETFFTYGPHNVGFGTHFVFWLYRGFFQMIFLVFGFYILLLLYWWTRKAREIRGATARAPEPGKRAEGGGEFTCTNCGADVSEGDAKCPSCGAVFEAEAPSEPADAKA